MKKSIRAFTLFLAVLLLVIPVNAADYEAKSVLLMEASTGKVLMEENADQALPPASVTKIMTLLLVMEAIDDGRLSWEEPVQTSEFAASMGGSQVFLEPGEELSVQDMVKCVVISSANDAAAALAEKVAGSEEAFVAKMNEKAAELGMANTHFENTNGLDDSVTEHLTSARDIAIMSRELITKHPKILEYSSIWMDSIRDGAFGLTNTNRLIRFYRGANGLKTGSTSKAGYCISATAERNGMTLIAVVMGAPSRDKRNEIAKKMLDSGFAAWEIASPSVGNIAPLPVKGGCEREPLLSVEDCSLLVKKGQAAKLSSTVELPDHVKAPIREGDVIGYVHYHSDGEELITAEIHAAETVERVGFGDLFSDFLRHILFVRDFF